MQTCRNASPVRSFKRVIICWAWLAIGLAIFGANRNPVFAQTQKPQVTDPPNIVLIFCDDLGYGDLGCYDHPYIETPHLDRLAEQGIRFTNFYSTAPVCSPARAGLLTGRIPNRAGIYDWIPSSNGDAKANARELVHLQRDEVTFSKKLQSAGYATFMAGKWHLNSRFNEPKIQPTPDHFGFETWIATDNNAQPDHSNAKNFVRNGVPVGEVSQYSCHFCVDQANQWMAKHVQRNPEQPFLVYLPFHESHEPVASPRILVEHYQGVARNKAEANYFANVTNVDLAVGTLLKRIEELKLADNTVVIFTSDNGPETLDRYKGAHRSYGVTGGLRGMKLHNHEGGIRVPALMRWPARFQGDRTSDAAVWAADLFPTLCEMANVPFESERLDGQSLLPLFDATNDDAFAETLKRQQPLFWCFYNALNPTQLAMRDGKWKVLARLDGTERQTNLTGAMLPLLKEAKLIDWELYDLSVDRSESNNLIQSETKVATELKLLLEKKYREILNDSPTWTSSNK